MKQYEHRVLANTYLDSAKQLIDKEDRTIGETERAKVLLAVAQVHATLAGPGAMTSIHMTKDELDQQGES